MRYRLAPADCGQAHDLLVTQIVSGLRRRGLPTDYIDEPEVGDAADARIREQLMRDAASDVYLGGISRGARVALHVAEQLPCAGLILWSFPFHARQEPGARERAHWLATCPVPVFLVQGTRDAMGNREQVRGYRLPEHITVHWVQDGNHALVPRQRSGRSQASELNRACDALADWIQDRS